jgi:hypothetical protein
MLPDETKQTLADQYICKLKNGMRRQMKISYKYTRILIVCLLLLISIAPVSAKNNGNGKGKGNGKDSHPDNKTTGASTHVSVDVFLGTDHDMIRAHYLPNPGSLPPGLAKRRGDLPPGLEKQLIRKGHLPPGLEKKMYPFPVELEHRLPPLQPGLFRGMIGGSAVIYNGNTKLILDVFKVF